MKTTTLRTLEDRNLSIFIVDLPALVWTFIAEDSDHVALVEGEGQSKWLDFEQPDPLTEQVVQEQWGDTFVVRVVPPNGPNLVDMFKISLNADAGFVELELDLPLSEANLFKFGSNEELEH